MSGVNVVVHHDHAVRLAIVSRERRESGARVVGLAGDQSRMLRPFQIRVAYVGRPVDIQGSGEDDATLEWPSRTTFGRGDPGASGYPSMATLLPAARE